MGNADVKNGDSQYSDFSLDDDNEDNFTDVGISKSDHYYATNTKRKASTC